MLTVRFFGTTQVFNYHYPGKMSRGFWPPAISSRRVLWGPACPDLCGFIYGIDCNFKVMLLWASALQGILFLKRLEDYIDVTPEEEKAITTLNTKWGTTPYFAALMDRTDPAWQATGAALHGGDRQ